MFHEILPGFRRRTLMGSIVGPGRGVGKMGGGCGGH
jgi:hypothetical protein